MLFRSEQTKGTLSELPQLPDMDPLATALYTQRVLAGEIELPSPIAEQIQHILRHLPK